MKREDIINKILKVKALADRGTEGEKKNAERMLNDLMQKYGISDEEIDVEKQDIYIIDTENPMFLQLFVQIYHMNYGRDREILDGSKMKKNLKKQWAAYGFGDPNGDILIRCTRAEFIEVKMLFELYKEDLKKQYDTFLYAYFMKNNLLVARNDNDAPDTNDDIEKAIKAMQMSAAIEKKEIYKMIENNNN